MLPGLPGQLIQLDRTTDEALLVEGDAPAQHAAEVFAGLEHLLEDRLALAQGRVWIDAAAGGQSQTDEQDG